MFQLDKVKKISQRRFTCKAAAVFHRHVSTLAENIDLFSIELLPSQLPSVVGSSETGGKLHMTWFTSSSHTFSSAASHTGGQHTAD